MERVAFQLPYIYKTTEKGRGRDGNVRVRNIKSVGKASGNIPVVTVDDAPVVARWTATANVREHGAVRDAVCVIRMFDGQFYARPKALHVGKYLNAHLCDQPLTFDGIHGSAENYYLIQMVQEVTSFLPASETRALGHVLQGWQSSGFDAPKGQIIDTNKDQVHRSVTRLIDSFIFIDGELWRRVLEPKIVFSISDDDGAARVMQTVDFEVFSSGADIWHRVLMEPDRPVIRSAFGLTEIGSEAIVKAFRIAEDAAGGNADAFRTALFDFEIEDPALFPFRHADDMVRRAAQAVVEGLRENVGTASTELIGLWFVLKDELAARAAVVKLRTSIGAVLARCAEEGIGVGDGAEDVLSSLRAMDAEFNPLPGQNLGMTC